MKNASLILLSITLAMFGCKPELESETKSLDHFAGAGGMNECSGDYSLAGNVAAKVEGPSALKAELLETIRAIPSHIQQELMQSGKFIIDDTSISCKGANVDLKSTPSSCQKFASDKTFVIHINATSADIKHATVQSLMRLLADTVFSGDAPSQLLGSSHNQIKSDIAKAYLEDVARAERKGHSSISLQTFANYLPAAALNARVTTQTRNNALDSISIRPEVQSLAENREIMLRDEFYSRILGEALDSYFCNAKTKASLNKGEMFELTGAALQPIINKIMATPAEDFNLNFFGLFSLGQSIYNSGTSMANAYNTPAVNSTASQGSNQGSSWGNWYNQFTTGVVNRGSSVLSSVGNAAYNSAKASNGYYTVNDQRYDVNLRSVYPGSNNSNYQYAKTTKDGGSVLGYDNYSNGGRYVYDNSARGYRWFNKDNQRTDYITSYNNGQWQQGGASPSTPVVAVKPQPAQKVPVEAPKP